MKKPGEHRKTEPIKCSCRPDHAGSQSHFVLLGDGLIHTDECALFKAALVSLRQAVAKNPGYNVPPPDAT